jgi:hypothetical protein
MTVNVPIAGVGKYLEKKMDKFARALVLKVDEAVKENTPVLSGRLAASWMIGQNDTSGSPKPPGTYSGVTPPTGSNYQPGKEKMGNVYSIHNNLPYAERICFTDYSTKAAPGWFELIAKNGESFADDLWDEISGED